MLIGDLGLLLKVAVDTAYLLTPHVGLHTRSL